MYYIILVIITLYILEVIYELGHFIGAKLNKIKVEEFSIGIGPKIVSKQVKGTIFRFKLLPIGGYVKMSEESNSNEKENAFVNLSAIRKISIILGGVLLTLIIIFILNVASTYKVDNHSVLECVIFSFNKTIYSIGDTYRQFGRIATNDINLRTYISGLFEALAVPTGIVNTEINLLSSIGIILVCINLLPIPALTGGQFWLTLLQGVTKKSIPWKVKFLINIISLMVFAALIIFALI